MTERNEPMRATNVSSDARAKAACGCASAAPLASGVDRGCPCGDACDCGDACQCPVGCSCGTRA
ncbi:MAG TPA: hypothetical protein VFG30_36175 [Polyangiales bacterium]|nr:hypothetical protein [Polyangiales bacterium]